MVPRAWAEDDVTGAFVAEPFSEDLPATLAKSAASGKPVLLLVKQMGNIGTLDAAHWLRGEPLVEKFECAVLWETNPALKKVAFETRSGLNFLTPKAEVITSEDIPFFRRDLRERLERVLETPQSMDALTEICYAEMKKGASSPTIDTSKFKRAIEVLRANGRAERALPLQQALNGIKLLKDHAAPAKKDDEPKREESSEEGSHEKKSDAQKKAEKAAKKEKERLKKEQEKREKESGKKHQDSHDGETTAASETVIAESDDEPIELLEIEARASIAGQINRAIRRYDAFQNTEKVEDRPKPESLKTGLQLAAQLMNREDAASVKAVADADAAVDAYAKDGNEENTKTARKALAALVPGLKASADALIKQAEDLREKFQKANPDHLQTKVGLLFKSLDKLERNKEAKEKAPQAVSELLALPMPQKTFATASGALMYVIISQEMHGAQREEIIKRIEHDLPVGRHAADALLDLSDIALEKGNKDEALNLLKAAEKASEKGESPTYYKAARQMRGLIDGKGSPNETKWAKRDIRDIVVLVSDYASYLEAISLWTDKDFFPVLFGDDLYTPKFVAAFKPAQVLYWPPKTVEKAGADPLGPVPAIDAIRHTVYQSWSSASDKQKAPQTVSDEELRAKLKKTDNKSMGVVFGDGESGEMAGAIALAAGRFQGIEIIKRPTVGNEGHIGDPEHYMDLPRINAMARTVRESLNAWGLPQEDRLALVTLAGRYPFRYFGENSRHGTTYAVDDMIGRDDEGLRIAACGRLMGDAARSTYQAMCSMFLQPESALLFNTYGEDPTTNWGYYRMTFAEDVFKARMPVTHVHGETANIEAFRAKTLPWNRDGLIMINSSGGPYSWSINGGGGTGEDLPVGGPSAIHIIHSGSAAELYDPESMAGRAVWGGAFWYFGSAAEPYLTAFQPTRFAAPRLNAGASFSATFRLRTAQNFWQPWRLLIVGDPQFCLREKDKPARRVPADEAIAQMPKASQLLRPEVADAEMRKMGEKFDVNVTPAEFTTLMRRARQVGNSFLDKDDFLVKTDLRQLDGPGLAMGIEELLKADLSDKAVELWNMSLPDAKKNYTARTLARLAASRSMDKALAAKKLKEFCTAFGDMLSTEPPRNYVDRFSAKVTALAAELKADAEYSAWLARIAQDPRAGAHRSTFLMESLKRKPEWTDDDKKTALLGFQSQVKEWREDWTLGTPFNEFADMYMKRIKGATPDAFATEVKGLFPADSGQAKSLSPLIDEFLVRQSLHKDWLILGPFKDKAVGAWAMIGPANDKTVPNFLAVFKDGAELKWNRPFKPEDSGIVDLAALLKPNENVYAYAAVDVEVELEIEGNLLAGSDDGITVWLDAKQIHANPAARGVKVDNDKVPVKLTAGTHSLVVRIDQGTGGWGFCARFADKDGKPLPGVKMRCPAK